MTTYAPQQWQDGEAGNTPITAARLRYPEAGISRAFGEVTRSDWIDVKYAEQTREPFWFDKPTLTWSGTSTATALTSPAEYRPSRVGTGTQTTQAAPWNGQDDPVFQFYSGQFYTQGGGNADAFLYGAWKPGGQSQAAGWPLIFGFTTSAGVQTVELGLYGLSTTYNAVLIEVNGRFVYDYLSVKPANLNTAGNILTLQFPTAAARTIRVWGAHSVGLQVVRVPTGQTISKPTTTVRRRVAVLGDSFVNGAGNSVSAIGNNGAGNLETFAPRLARLMDADDIMLAGIGGTGWVAGTGGTGGASNAYGTRLDVVLAAQPHVLVIYGSINDGTAGTGVQQAVTDLLARCTAVPQVYVIGPLTAGYEPANAAVKTATLAAGRKFIDLGGFLNGTGKVDNPKGDGNRDAFMMADGAHPTFVAHKAIAPAVYRGIVSPVT